MSRKEHVMRLSHAVHRRHGLSIIRTLLEMTGVLVTRHYPRRFDSRINFRGTNALRLTFPIRDMYIEAIDRLGKVLVQVTVIDRNNHHLFQPLLYQVATGILSPAEICSPSRDPAISRNSCGHLTRSSQRSERSEPSPTVEHNPCNSRSKHSLLEGRAAEWPGK